MKPLDSALDAAAKAIIKHQNFLITVHIKPDGDALGSQLALYLFLKKLGKNVTLWNKDPVSETYKFLPASSEIRCVGNNPPEESFEVIFILDAGDPKRIGYFIPSFSEELISVDHHARTPMFGTINCIDESACATSEIIYRLIEKMGDHLDHDIALNLYVGIFTDTGSFRFNNTSKRAFTISAHLMDYGIQAHIVAENIFYSVPLARLRLLSRCLKTLEVEDKIASISIQLDDYAAENIPITDTDDFINFPRSLSNVSVAVLFKEIEQDVYKISLRSKGEVDVAAVARHFEGGGHRNASGFKISGSSFLELKKLVFESVRTAIKHS